MTARPISALARSLIVLLLILAPSVGVAESAALPDSAPDPLFDDDFELDEPAGFPDPLENLNRKTLRLNQGIDKVFLTPLMKGIDFLFPGPVKFSLRRVFQNANSPVVLLNDLLQLEWTDAAVTSGAFVVNTTAGLGGLFEPGEKIGLPRHRSDFGQTLALAEVPSGPYLVFPLFGPANARDASGAMVDVLLQPLTWFFGLGAITALQVGSEGVVTLEEHHGKMKELEKSAVDFYPVLKSAYYQNRMDQIWGRREDRKPAADE